MYTYREEAAASLEIKGQWQPESRVGIRTAALLVLVHKWPIAWNVFAVGRFEVISERVRALREDDGHLTCITQWEDFKVVCECLHAQSHLDLSTTWI